ncbi:sensor histidine kinase [Thiohalorhabdus denitrificans]|uniref:histidine kinase n=1 Tax=Thiohalorhabdus denitrificans TaxID=381306 RepID=A0A1G5HAB9_9GAMM|nr:ATP-binding protein [Thiohalorhabdus denitrificans]SCY59918.1 two-component system, NtrC family, sensor kinase [Thiohalorhabdus denitrificans]
MRLRSKLLLLLAAATLPPLLAILLYAGHLSSRTLEEQVNRDMHLLLQRGVAEVETLLDNQKATARALAEVPVLRRYLDAVTDGGDPGEARSRLEEYLLAFQEAKPTVQGVRFLDLRGNSLVKVKQGRIVPPEGTGDHGLPVVANHAHKKFFRDARFLESDEVGVSNFELGSVSPDKDFCPAMIRFTTPLEHGGERLGYLVVNVWGRHLDRMLGGMIAERKGHAFLAEYNRIDLPRDGVFLYHPDESKRFANQRRHSAYLGGVLGEPAARRIHTQEQGMVVLPDSGDRIYFNRFSPYGDPTRAWVLGIRADTAALLSPTRELLFSIAAVGLVALLAILGLSRWAAAGVTTPIHRLASKVRRLAEGDLSVRCRTDRSDEVGSLARTFDYLADSLEQAQRERDQAEEQACRAAKLASVGELAGGLAHEINNPLNNIRSLATLIERDLPADVPERAARDLRTLRQECEQCSRIIQGLLNFGRQMDPELREVDLPTLVEQSLQLLERKARAGGVGLVYEQPSGPVPPVLGDPHQLQQVLVNVLLNAIQASPDQSAVRVTMACAGEGVEVRVADEGAGIPRETLDRIFDPFFSTKPEGQGSGLGLSVSYGIVARHGGEIHVDSLPGAGTTVRLSLPTEAGGGAGEPVAEGRAADETRTEEGVNSVG